MRSILIILFFILTIVSAKSYGQKWQPGHFTDIKGNIETGLLRFGSGKAPIRGEAFIEFKEDKKAEPFKLSASDLKSFVIARDSFVVAHAPDNETWAHNRKIPSMRPCQPRNHPFLPNLRNRIGAHIINVI